MQRRVLVFGAIGGREPFHLGDEAVLEAALDEIGRREDIAWTLISADPAGSSERYGVDAIPGMGFDRLRDLVALEARLSTVLDAARGDSYLDATDPAHTVLDATIGTDAVLVLGSARLCSTSLYEMAALSAVADLRAKPVIVSGQALAPQLRAREEELLGTVLRRARFVGVRDSTSAADVERLGVPGERIWPAADDAAFLDDRPRPDLLTNLGLEPGGFVAATLAADPSSDGDDLLEPLAGLLDDIVRSTGLDVLLIPHEGGCGENATHDCALHDGLTAAAKSDRIRAAPLLSGREAAWSTRQAALVVSSRPQAIGFALPARIPLVGISSDDTTDRELSGVLAPAGLGSWCVSRLGLRSGVVGVAVAQAWQRRGPISTHLGVAVPKLQAHKMDYWDAVGRAVVGHPVGPSAAALDGDAPAAAVADGEWTGRNDDALHWDRAYAARRRAWERTVTTLEEQRDVLTDRLQRERNDRAAAQAEAASLTEALAVERAAVDAARMLNAELLQRSIDDRPTDRRQQVVELAAVIRPRLRRPVRAVRALARLLRGRPG